MKREIITNFFQTAKAIINQPRETFTHLSKSNKFRPHVQYLVILWVAGSLLSTLGTVIFSYLLPLILAAVSKQAFTPAASFIQYLSGGLINTLISIIIGVLFTFLGSLLLHIWVRIFQGKGTFLRTFQLNTYAMTPSMLFGWVPFASILASFYGLYLLLIGGQVLHGLSIKKGIIMFIILPIAVSIGVAILLSSLGITLPQAG